MRLEYSLNGAGLNENIQQAPSALVLAEEFAKPFERLYLKAYFDPAEIDPWGRRAGYPTQGWGHLLLRRTKHELMTECGLDFSKREDHDKYEPIFRERWPDWDKETADRWLQSDLRKADASVSRLLPVPLRPQQRAACIDFAFNAGAGNLQSSTLRRLVLRGDMLGAADQFLRYNKSRGVVLPGLTKRCQARRFLFLSAC